MYLPALLPIALSLLFGVLGPRLCRQLPPAAATWLLSVGAAVAATASSVALALLGATLIGRFPDVASRGHWADAVLNRADPAWVPVVATLTLAVLASRCVTTGIRRGWALHDAHRLAASLPTATGELVVEAVGSTAYSLPGRPGRIVISRELLRRLDAAERRAVLAHERAHLRHHHHLHLALAAVAAAANPLLIRIPGALALSVERWADEDAVRVSDRGVVARALRQSARHPSALSASPLTLAAGSVDVVTRLSALDVPAPRVRADRIAVVVGLVLAVALATVHAEQVTDRVFDLAQVDYSHHHRHSDTR